MSITTIPTPIQEVETTGTTSTQDLEREATQQNILTELKKNNLQLTLMTGVEIDNSEVE